MHLTSELESDLWDTADLGTKWLTDLSAGKLQLLFNQSNLYWYETSLNSICIDMKINEPVLLEKSSFKIQGLCFSFKLDRGFYIVSYTKTASKKIGDLIGSMKFFSPGFTLYICKSLNLIKALHETLLSCLDWCSVLLVGCVR